MKKLTVIFAALVMMLGFAGTASAQHHGNDGFHGNNGFHGSNGYHGNNGIGVNNGFRGGYDGYRGGRGGIDIIIGGRPGYPRGGWNGGWYGGYNGGYYPQTRIVYERVCDQYGGCYSVSHVARWDNYYRGFVWYDVNGNLRVN